VIDVDRIETVPILLSSRANKASVLMPSFTPVTTNCEVMVNAALEPIPNPPIAELSALRVDLP
jgi:hypothetical protein